MFGIQADAPYKMECDHVQYIGNTVIQCILLQYYNTDKTDITDCAEQVAKGDNYSKKRVMKKSSN